MSNAENNDSIIKSCGKAFVEGTAVTAGIFTGLAIVGTVIDFVKKRENKKNTPDKS